MGWYTDDRGGGCSVALSFDFGVVIEFVEVNVTLYNQSFACWLIDIIKLLDSSGVI